MPPRCALTKNQDDDITISMKQILSIFSIRREERWLACGALLYVVVLNAMVIGCYADRFMVLTDNYHKLFVNHFHVSGFDPLTYSVVSQWGTEYNIYRHPLLAYFMYVPYLLNRGLMALTGTNCVQLVVGVLLAFCTFYSFMLLYRIFREVIGLRRTDGALLAQAREDAQEWISRDPSLEESPPLRQKLRESLPEVFRLLRGA